MSNFLTEDFLLDTELSRRLYHEHAARLPIIDYHSHIDPAEIAQNRVYGSLAEIWLERDHYKWRLMRAAGVPEQYITGDAPDDVKLREYAGVLQYAIGNPLYHWSHLELWRYFGVNEPLTPDNAARIGEAAGERLKSMPAREIVRMSSVEVLCTTDDPADDLIWHKQIANEAPPFKMLPTFRPDNALNIENAGFGEYIARLSAAADIEILSFNDLCAALTRRLDYFCALGCVTSDHGLEYVPYESTDIFEIERIFNSRLATKEKTPLKHAAKYKTALLMFLSGEYHKRNMVMQLHFGCKRNNNPPAVQRLGADAGYDCIAGQVPLNLLTDFLNALAERNSLPKTILYSLNPNDNAALATIAGCFQEGAGFTKVQHGAPWWFNDHLRGITDHFENLSALGYLPGFVGMLTDSRSLLSYTRHEYFRRILCAYLGRLAKKGLFTQDFDILSYIVKNICYYNAKQYFLEEG